MMECMGGNIVLIHRGVREYCIICLVEVLWKVVTISIDQHLVDSIEFHDVLHGFRSRR